MRAGSGPPPVVAVVGPTASGKSDLGVALALRLGGEVVNADAMQLYRGMDIGTAKLSPGERRGVAHHGLDVLDVTDEASVAAYQRDARADLAAILGRGARPVVVGGSGLYVRAVLDALEFPGTDADVRAALERRAEEVGPEALHAELARVDPAAAAAIDPRNTRRVVRALEVVELTGRPYSATLPEYTYAAPAVQIGLRSDLDALDARIAARVERMWAAGLVEEVRALVDRGLREGRTAPRAVGYAEVLELLDGACDEDGAREAIARNTRRLARRQMRWFIRDPRIVWLDADAPDLVDSALAVVERGLGSAS